MDHDLEEKLKRCHISQLERPKRLSQKRVIREYDAEPEGYIKKENAQAIIIHTRKEFEAALLKYKGPTIIPTIFKNHPERHTFVREREKQLCNVRNPVMPPEYPLTLFTFAEDVYLNLHINFRDNDYQAYIKHVLKARIICLNRESCGEDAFEEMLMCTPFFYSDNMETVKLSRYADPIPTPKNWSIFFRCTNTSKFVVDFSIIFPKGKVSSAVVICTDCGRFVETVLCGNTIEVLKKELWHNICNLDFSSIEANPVRGVHRLPTRGCVLDGCAFSEGLIGVTALTGIPFHPSVFVRTRVFYFCNNQSLFSSVVHESIDEEDLYTNFSTNEY